MSGYKYLNSRQVQNILALPNIGSAADASLDIILSDINTVLGGLIANTSYIAENVPLTIGTTSVTVNFSSRLDLSYICLAIMENETDTYPVFQQLVQTGKTLTTATFSWNVPLLTSNYSLTFVIPPITLVQTESVLPISTSVFFAPLNVPQNGPQYGIVAALENHTDTYPQFQTPIVENQSFMGFVETLNAPTLTANNELIYLGNPTGQIAIPSGVTSITATLPTPYGTGGYAVLASMSNVTDSYVRAQPLIITNKSSSTFTISWNASTTSAYNLLNYYAISLLT